MSWSVADIILGIILLFIIGGAFYLVNDAKKKGVHSCSKSCSTCIHPCHPMGDIKPEDDKPES